VPSRQEKGAVYFAWSGRESSTVLKDGRAAREKDRVWSSRTQKKKKVETSVIGEWKLPQCERSVRQKHRRACNGTAECSEKRHSCCSGRKQKKKSLREGPGRGEKHSKQKPQTDTAENAPPSW